MKITAAQIMQTYRIKDLAGFDAQACSHWRDTEPVWDYDRCCTCGICWISCPDAAIFRTGEGYFDRDPERCKGCGVCARECVNDAITMTAVRRQM
jgi:2-oxoacid:acceptor oxidoreductase delta subunit (pyruvate/2-ketoisovalerate family)